MAVTSVWVLPGFGGSTLWLRGTTGPQAYERQLWITLRGVIDPMSLALLRIPLTLGETTIAARSVLDYGFAPFLKWLEDHKPTADYRVMPYPYDWRLGVQASGQALANAIRTAGATTGTDHRLIGHSMGGLVALAAWRYLKETGDEGLVKRIATIGTPLYGSYLACVTWRGEYSPLNLVSRLGAVFGPVLAPAASGANGTTYQRLVTYISIFNTWPAVYDLLPRYGAPEDPPDADGRARAYEASQWSNALSPPLQAEMDRSRNVFQPWLAATLAMVPQTLLVHYVGAGYVTPVRMVGPIYGDYSFAVAAVRRDAPTLSAAQAFQRAISLVLPQVETSNNGDSVASIYSTQLTGGEVVGVRGEHTELLSDPAVLQDLYARLAPRAPGPVPPPVERRAPAWPVTPSTPATAGGAAPPLLRGGGYPNLDEWGGAPWTYVPATNPDGSARTPPPPPAFGQY